MSKLRSRRLFVPLRQSFPALCVPFVYTRWSPAFPSDEFLGRTGFSRMACPPVAAEPPHRPVAFHRHFPWRRRPTFSALARPRFPVAPGVLRLLAGLLRRGRSGLSCPCRICLIHVRYCQPPHYAEAFFHFLPHSPESMTMNRKRLQPSPWPAPPESRSRRLPIAASSC